MLALWLAAAWCGNAQGSLLHRMREQKGPHGVVRAEVHSCLAAGLDGPVTASQCFCANNDGAPPIHCGTSTARGTGAAASYVWAVHRPGAGTEQAEHANVVCLRGPVTKPLVNEILSQNGPSSS